MKNMPVVFQEKYCLSKYFDDLKSMIFQAFFLFICCSHALGQVNQEIYSEQDLLAIDSEIQPQVVVLPPPGLGLDIDSNSIAGECSDRYRMRFGSQKEVLHGGFNYL